MPQVARVPGVATVILLPVAFTFSATAVAAVVPDQTHSTPRLTVARLPLAFEPNVGQAPPDVRFMSRANGHHLWLSGTDARLAPRGGKATGAIRLRWVGGTAAPAIAAEERLPGQARYYAEGDPDQSRQNVPMYGRVTYRGVYPGIDLVFHGTQRQAEFDFVVGPGAHPGAITLEVTDADDVTWEAGNLVAHRGEARMRLHKPVVYQAGPAGRVPVDGRFRVAGRRITFEVGDYDRDRPLVIDPVVTYSTYYGTSGSESGTAIAIDGSGNFYALIGNAIVKLSADGATRLYSVV